MPPRKSRVDPVKAVVRRVIEAVEGGDRGRVSGGAALPQAMPPSLPGDAPPPQRMELFRELRAVIETSAENRTRLVALLVDEVSDGRIFAYRRFGVLRVLDELFTKSRLFRDSMVEALEPSVSRICMGKPSNQAEILRNEIAVAFLHVLHNWDVRFGDYYPILRSMARYYRYALRLINLGDHNAEAPAALTDPRRASEERDRRLLLATSERAVKECGDAINHIEQSLDAAEEIFRLLFPSFEITSATLLRPESPLTKRKRTVIDDSIAPNSLTSDIYAAVEWEENEDDGGGNRNPNSNPNSSVIKTISSAGLGSLGYNLEINIGVTATSMTTKDTEVLIEELKAIYVQLSRSSVRKLSDWHDLFRCTIAELSKSSEPDASRNMRSHRSDSPNNGSRSLSAQSVCSATSFQPPPPPPASLITVRSLEEIDAAVTSLKLRVETFLNERGHDFFKR